MAKSKDISFSEGKTRIIAFKLRDAAGQALDLTGALVEWAVESTVAGGASLLVDSSGSFITITDAEAGARHRVDPAGQPFGRPDR